MKFIVLGTSDFTLACTRALIKCNVTVSALISLPEEGRPLNSADIASFAKKSNVNYMEFNDINSAESLKYIYEKSPDYIFSSWPKLINNDVLAIPKYFVIGTHPTELPRNRGRHPLHWIIDLGIMKTSLSFFVMDKGVDSGDILLQLPILIDEQDSIVDINAKVIRSAEYGVQKLIPSLSDIDASSVQKQDHKSASYWRKRSPFDVVIDFRMPAKNILRTIRSYIPPYPSAKIVFCSCIIKIIDGNIIQKSVSQYSLEQMEPGKILSKDQCSLTVKSGDDIIHLISDGPLPHEILDAKYIHPPAKYFAESHEALLLALDS